MTASEYFSFTAGIALKSLDFVSALIKRGLSILRETLWQVFYLSTVIVVGILKTWSPIIFSFILTGNLDEYFPIFFGHSTK